MLDDVVVMVLAGGVGERLSPLTKERAKPAVYFGGPYRIIDFTLSNCLNSGLREDLRVLLRTPNSALWNTTDGFHTDYTYLTEGAAKFLVGQGVKVVGVDYLSVEQYKKAGAPAHKALLGNGVIIIEGLNLSEAEAGQYEMYCLPLRVAGADGAPARVVLKR